MKALTRDNLDKLPAKLRGTITVGSHEVPVFLSNLKPFNVFGVSFDEPEPAIWLDKGATRQQQHRTLVHEACEVINAVYDMGLNETQIRILEQSLCQSFRMTLKGARNCAQ